MYSSPLQQYYRLPQAHQPFSLQQLLPAPHYRQFYRERGQFFNHPYLSRRMAHNYHHQRFFAQAPTVQAHPLAVRLQGLLSMSISQISLISATEIHTLRAYRDQSHALYMQWAYTQPNPAERLDQLDDWRYKTDVAFQKWLDCFEANHALQQREVEQSKASADFKGALHLKDMAYEKSSTSEVDAANRPKIENWRNRVTDSNLVDEPSDDEDLQEYRLGAAAQVNRDHVNYLEAAENHGYVIQWAVKPAKKRARTTSEQEENREKEASASSVAKRAKASPQGENNEMLEDPLPDRTRKHSRH